MKLFHQLFLLRNPAARRSSLPSLRRPHLGHNHPNTLRAANHISSCTRHLTPQLPPSTMASTEGGPASNPSSTNSVPGHAFILDLPTEMLSMVVADCEVNHLANLRLTCKGLCAPSTQPFGRAFFDESLHLTEPHDRLRSNTFSPS